MTMIALSGKRGEGKFALVDDRDFELVNSFSWFVNSGGYAKRKIHKGEPGFVHDGDKQITMQDFIAGKPPKGFFNDHEDCVRLNNQRYNLRLSTRTENNANRKMGKFNKSGYKGVVFCANPRAHRKPWYASVSWYGKRYNKGYFATAREAAEMYNQMALKIQGACAYLNEL